MNAKRDDEEEEEGMLLTLAGGGGGKLVKSLDEIGVEVEVDAADALAADDDGKVAIVGTEHSVTLVTSVVVVMVVVSITC